MKQQLKNSDTQEPNPLHVLNLKTAMYLEISARHSCGTQLTPPPPPPSPSSTWRSWFCFVTQLLEAVEDGGYEATLRSIDEEGDVEFDDPEIKAAKVSTAHGCRGSA